MSPHETETTADCLSDRFQLIAIVEDLLIFSAGARGFEDDAGFSAEEGGWFADEILGGGEEVAEIGGRANTVWIDSARGEGVLVVRRVASGPADGLAEPVHGKTAGQSRGGIAIAPLERFGRGTVEENVCDFVDHAISLMALWELRPGG